MKKILICIFLCLFSLFFSVNKVDAVETLDFITLGGNVDILKNDNHVYQNSSIIRQGCSIVRYGYESKANNKFIRLSNFKLKQGVNYTGFVIDFGGVYELKSLNIYFKYRLFEGIEYYQDDDVILKLIIGSETLNLTLEDLIVSKDGDFSWNEKALESNLEKSIEADQLIIYFYYSNNVVYNDNKCFIDMDNIALNDILSVDFNFADADENSSLDYDLSSNLDEQRLAMLNKNQIIYEDNTIYSNKVSYDFDANYLTQILARSGSSGTYRGVTSVNAKESDGYVLYDLSNENTYLKLGNFNGKDGVTSTRVVNYLYDNNTNETTTINKINRIYYSFKYRLYMDDLVLSDLNKEEWAIKISGGSSDSAKSGWISFDELIINNENDDTWHEYHGWINVQVYSKITYLVMYVDLKTPAGIDTKSYVDIDDFVITTPKGDNVSHLGGSFEGLLDYNSVKDNYIEDYQTNAKKVVLSNDNYCLALDKDEYLTIDLNWQNKLNVYHISFDYHNLDGQLKFFVGGKNGDEVVVDIGKDYISEDGLLIVYFENNICNIYLARQAKYPLTKVILTNVGDNELKIDNLFIGQIESVSFAGDYNLYLMELESIKSNINQNIYKYNEVVNLRLAKADYLATKVDVNASQVRLNQVLDAYRNVLSDELLKSDLSRLNATINRAKSVMSERDESEYERASWLLFFDTYKKALLIDETNTQEEVDLANKALWEAIDSLKIKSESSNNIVSVVVATACGATALGAAAFFVFGKRRFL